MKIRPEIAARALKLAAYFEDTEPDCEPFARAYGECQTSARCIRPYTDWRTEEVGELAMRLWRSRTRMGAIRWNERVTNIARIAGDEI